MDTWFVPSWLRRSKLHRSGLILYTETAFSKHGEVWIELQKARVASPDLVFRLASLGVVA